MNSVTTAVIDDELDAPLFVTCPMCHSATSLTQSAVDAGGACRCVRCGQRWDATRLSAMAAYTKWAVERVASQAAALSGSVPAEPLGGSK